MVVTDINPFYFAAIGGVILGIATSINYCLRGKVTGMSGMLYSIFFWNRCILSIIIEDIHEKLSIIGGMLVAAGMFFDIFGYGSSNNFTPYGPELQITAGTSYLGYALAGLLVGFGTKLGNGCTSGHGLCGVSRFSKRSIVAVITFLSCALAISTLRYHRTLGPFSDENLNPKFTYQHLASANVILVVGAFLPLIGGYLHATLENNNKTAAEMMLDQIVTFITGLLFGMGLMIAGMVRRINILGFLGLGRDWNPSLLFVLGCGVLVNLVTFSYMIHYKKISYFGNSLFNPKSSQIDWKLLLGASCFGLGWGIGGLCPGPAIMQLAVFTVPVHILWLGCLFLGMLCARKLDQYLQSKDTGEKGAQSKNAVRVQSPTKDGYDPESHEQMSAGIGLQSTKPGVGKSSSDSEGSPRHEHEHSSPHTSPHKRKANPPLQVQIIPHQHVPDNKHPQLQHIELRQSHLPILEVKANNIGKGPSLEDQIKKSIS